MVMSLSKPLDELVLPGRESIWKAQKPNWFVTDPDCPDQKREPGLQIKVLSLSQFILFRSAQRRVFYSKWLGGISLAEMLYHGR